MEDLDAVLRQALDLGEEERWEEMAEALADALDRAEDDPFLLCWLGVAESELGNDGAAYEAFRRCVDQDPEDPTILALAGSGLAQFDDPDAEPALRAAALTGPDLLVARLNYGAYLTRAGLVNEGLEQLAAARALEPEDPVVRSEIGAGLVLGGRPGEGLAELEEALVLAPDDSWTRVIYGLVLVELDRLPDAAEALVHAGRERGEDAEAMVLGALAAAAVDWEDPARELLALAEYAAEGTDVTLIGEAEAAVDAGPDAARLMLRQTAAPSALRDRLAQPL
jgi:predicted Zn-dependent protease